MMPAKIGAVSILVVAALAACNTEELTPAPAISIVVTELYGGIDDLHDTVPHVPDDRVFYVAASGAATGVFGAPLSETDAAPELLAGGFVDARAVVTSVDGDTIYVADPEASTPDGGGAVFAVPASGGDASIVVGTAGKQPRALDLVVEDGEETLYFAGSDDGAAVWRVPAAGGTAVKAAAGFSAPQLDGVAVAEAGAIFAAGGEQVFRADASTSTAIASGVTLGDPAGIALVKDDSLLLVSSLSSAGTSQVLIVELRTLATSVFDEVIGANVGSGGLHRSKHDALTEGSPEAGAQGSISGGDSNVEVLTWAGTTAGVGGSVYSVSIDDMLEESLTF